MRQIPLTFRHSFGVVPSISAQLLGEQSKVIREIANQGRDCIIVGRNADVVLEEYSPLRIFVYADMDSKIKRCIERASEGEDVSESVLKKKIKQIDSSRSRTRELVSSLKWGQKEAYDLMLNTAGWGIKELANLTTDYVKAWFAKR